MRKILVVLAIISQTLTAQENVERYLTTAKLPENKMIWPLPECSKFKNNIHVTGRFIEAKPILTVKQGNWAQHTFLIRYKITTPGRKYPYDKVSFIVNRRWPTRESKIRMKALVFHFRKGLMEFVLKKDDNVRYMDFFNIMTYRQLSAEKHRTTSSQARHR